jgi:hypothetical protein
MGTRLEAMVAPLLRTFGDGHAGRLLCFGRAQGAVAENVRFADRELGRRDLTASSGD